MSEVSSQFVWVKFPLHELEVGHRFSYEPLENQGREDNMMNYWVNVYRMKTNQLLRQSTAILHWVVKKNWLKRSVNIYKLGGALSSNKY